MAALSRGGLGSPGFAVTSIRRNGLGEELGERALKVAPLLSNSGNHSGRRATNKAPRTRNARKNDCNLSTRNALTSFQIDTNYFPRKNS